MLGGVHGGTLGVVHELRRRKPVLQLCILDTKELCDAIAGPASHIVNVRVGEYGCHDACSEKSDDAWLCQNEVGQK